MIRQRALMVYSNSSRVGVLLDNANIWAFAYAPDWVRRSDAFALAPSLPLGNEMLVDGASTRPVQWFFDNLLPEEKLREVVAKEAGIRTPEDSFELLAYLGKESAGSLTLLARGEDLVVGNELVPLMDSELSERIRKLPRSMVDHDRKRMSLAGAQHKMLAVIKYKHPPHLFEPVGNAPSTFILKPNHPSTEDFPASVMNEYVTMKLAAMAKLPVPVVEYRQVPEPLYCVKRFDRNYAAKEMEAAPFLRSAEVERLHMLDGCQLLNIPSQLKYASASLETLNRLIDRCNNKAQTRIALFRWLVFNMAVGNNDNHLKNLSFFVSHQGIELAPHYDLLCTLAYETTVVNSTAALTQWAEARLVFPLPGAERFSEVSRESTIKAGVKLGLTEKVSVRHLNEICTRLEKAIPEVLAPDASYLAGVAQHGQVARAMEKIVFKEMLARLNQSSSHLSRVQE